MFETSIFLTGSNAVMINGSIEDLNVTGDRFEFVIGDRRYHDIPISGLKTAHEIDRCVFIDVDTTEGPMTFRVTSVLWDSDPIPGLTAARQASLASSIDVVAHALRVITTPPVTTTVIIDDGCW